MKNGKHELPSGNNSWYLNDQLHRENGPAVEHPSGTKAWYLNDRLHRENGPAIEWCNEVKEWWLNGRRHREDGPAFEHPDGSRQWWINGDCLSEEEFNQWLMKKNLNEKLHATLPHKPIIKRGKI